MKLFGNKRGAAHVGKRTASHGSGRKHRLSGVQRGLLLLVCSIAILSLTVYGVYKDFVKPPENLKNPDPAPVVTQPVGSEEEQTEQEQEQEEVFLPPTVIEVQKEIDETGNEIEVEVEVPASQKEGFYNILIVGTDDDGTRTDTIMIGRMNTVDHSVALLSIPRDTLITGNYSVPKINSVYGVNGKGDKGIQALKTKLAQLLGFEVNGYVIVDLSAFIELVDLVGGVDFDVPQNMYYNDPTQDLYINLAAGMQHLDGEEAMGLVRFRKGYASQDIQRTHVQQDFLKALAKKCLKEISLSKLSGMADIFMENVTTDLTIGNIVYFGQELLKCDFENMYSYTLEGEAVSVNGVSCWAIYLNRTLEAVNGYFNPYETEITAAHVSIRTPSSVYASQAATPSTPEETDEPEQTEPADPNEPENPDEPVDTNEPSDPGTDPETPPEEEIPEFDPLDPLAPVENETDEGLNPDELWP